jgi:hypothetical protein
MLIKLVSRLIPERVRKKELELLFNLTAEAFRVPGPDLGRLTFAECLSEYAAFTEELSRRFPENSPLGEEIKSRLYQNAFDFGAGVRKRFYIKSRKQSLEALQAVYGFIGIDFRILGPNKEDAGSDKAAAGENGAAGERTEFVVRKCFFSSRYSEAACRQMASLDAGMAEGLTGGGLCFTQRITDGSVCCRGYLCGGQHN